MNCKEPSAFSFFFIWLGIGFLLGLTGTVIASPFYIPPVDNEPKLVYGPGLQLQSQPQVQKTGTSYDTKDAPPEEIFLQKGCTQCHQVSFYAMSGGVTGPDLSIAYQDVPDRFGKTLAEFLVEPEGTMAEMFKRMEITDDERALILDLLTNAAGNTTESPNTGDPSP